MEEEPKKRDWRDRANHGSKAEEALLKSGIPTRYLKADLDKDDLPIFQFLPDSSYYLFGSTGAGKTHLLCAMMKERILSRWDNRSCLFITVDDMLDGIRSAFNRPKRTRDEEDEDESKMDSLLTRYRTVEVLGIDDLGAERITDFTKHELYKIINHRYNYMLVTYITSNLSISELATQFDERIAGRLTHMCDIIEVVGEDKRSQ